MLKALQVHDQSLVALTGDKGAVLVSPLLQGRIFCQLGGELIHRLDADRMRHPVPNEFNNLGGNILWPAPEGGPFAFNYPPNSTQWAVQEDIANAPALVTSRAERQVTVEKNVNLVNHRGIPLRLSWKRRVELADLADDAPKGAVQAIAYTSDDTLAPLDRVSPRDVLLAAWSLEQFPGGEGVTAFAGVEQPPIAINSDFYGEPASAPVFGNGSVTLALGGPQKFQIGVRVNSGPRLIGALDRRRSLLILRQTAWQDGLYFNIADNAQPRGPWSEADLYSIFSGGEMNLFELETIAPMRTDGSAVQPSRLVSKTMIFKGPVPVLADWLKQRHGIVC